MAALELNVTPVYTRNMDAPGDIIINRGGTRSSKTYSLAQLFITKLISERDKRFLISRKTSPALRLSVKATVMEILKETYLYDLGKEHKTEGTFTYTPTGSVFHFVAVDDPQKFRGPEWNYVWMNEANEFQFEEFNQLYLRLSRKSSDGKPNQMYIDFNPSDPYTWIKLELEDKQRGHTIISTYKDNTFLDARTVQKIDWLKDNDPDFWKIYGLGQYGEIKGLVFPNWEIVKDFPKDCKKVFYGMDFGYTNDPTTLVKIGLYNGALYLDELIHKTGLLNSDIVNIFDKLGLEKRGGNAAKIYADAADPKAIAELFKAGYNVKAAKKGADSIKYGISLIKQYPLHITSNSPNLIKEAQSYKWATDKNGNTLNAPIDFYNHCWDAIRYGCIMNLTKSGGMKFV